MKLCVCGQRCHGTTRHEREGFESGAGRVVAPATVRCERNKAWLDVKASERDGVGLGHARVDHCVRVGAGAIGMRRQRGRDDGGSEERGVHGSFAPSRW